MANLDKFFADTLRTMGAPPTKENIAFLKNWQKHEGGWTNNSASFNPLNTTSGPGSSINSVGVKAFGDYGTGVKMTAQTMLNGRYPNIVAGLKAGNPYSTDISGDLSTWVSGSPTKGLSYAQKVMGDRKASGRVPLASPGPNVPVRGKTPRRGGLSKSASRSAQMAWINIAQNYAETGEVNNNSVARVLGAVDRLGTVEPPAPKQAQAKTRSPLAGGVVDGVLAAAHNQVGKPYVFGSGPDTSSFDCSDLIQYAYKQMGIDIPRVTGDQIKVGQPVKWGQFKPGDLIFSNGGGHVVMYVGGGKVIAAPRTGTVVQYQPVSQFKNGFVGARRIVQ